MGIQVCLSAGGGEESEMAQGLPSQINKPLVAPASTGAIQAEVVSHVPTFEPQPQLNIIANFIILVIASYYFFYC